MLCSASPTATTGKLRGRLQASQASPVARRRANLPALGSSQPLRGDHHLEQTVDLLVVHRYARLDTIDLHRRFLELVLQISKLRLEGLKKRHLRGTFGLQSLRLQRRAKCHKSPPNREKRMRRPGSTGRGGARQEERSNNIVGRRSEPWLGFIGFINAFDRFAVCITCSSRSRAGNEACSFAYSILLFTLRQFALQVALCYSVLTALTPPEQRFFGFDACCSRLGAPWFRALL